MVVLVDSRDEVVDSNEVDLDQIIIAARVDQEARDLSVETIHKLRIEKRTWTTKRKGETK